MNGKRYEILLKILIVNKCDICDDNNSVALVRERTIPTERPPLVGEVVPTFADRGCHVVGATDPYSRILGFLDRTCFFFKAAPQLY
jgi:hypothetical protein